MGSLDGDADEHSGNSTNSTREVTVSQPFFLSEGCVKNTDYEKHDPGHRQERGEYSPGDSQPAARLSWHEAINYCQWLNEKSKINGLNDKNGSYRLASEAEYERAARGGLDQKRYPWGDTVPASEKNFYSATAAAGVEEGKANGYGIRQSTANVFSWIFDWYASYKDCGCSNRDPTSPTLGSVRVFLY